MKRMIFVLVLVLITSSAFGGIITFDPFPSIPDDVTVQYFDGGLTGPLATLPTPNTVALTSISLVDNYYFGLLLYYVDWTPPFGP